VVRVRGESSTIKIEFLLFIMVHSENC
jgi:hypothetical protein